MGRMLIEAIPFHIDTMAGYVGKQLGESDWMPIDQNRIDLFSEATEDRNPLHVDRAWAAADGPFGSTVAHGFLTLSLLSHLSRIGELQPDGVDYGINLGFERVRFVSPVTVDDRIKLRVTLMEIKPRACGQMAVQIPLLDRHGKDRQGGVERHLARPVRQLGTCGRRRPTVGLNAAFNAASRSAIDAPVPRSASDVTP